MEEDREMEMGYMKRGAAVLELGSWNGIIGE